MFQDRKSDKQFALVIFICIIISSVSLLKKLFESPSSFFFSSFFLSFFLYFCFVLAKIKIVSFSCAND